MLKILKNITDRLPGLINEANFEGANIVLYTKNENFFLEGEARIKEIVNDIKKRIELRADTKILISQEIVEKKIKEIVPEEAEITEILFDLHRSIVTIEAKKPGLVIGKQGSILNEIRKQTSGEIAEIAGVSGSVILDWLRKYGISRRTGSKMQLKHRFRRGSATCSGAMICVTMFRTSPTCSGKIR